MLISVKNEGIPHMIGYVVYTSIRDCIYVYIYTRLYICLEVKTLSRLGCFGIMLNCNREIINCNQKIKNCNQKTAIAKLQSD